MDYSDETPERYWITNPEAHGIGTPPREECEMCRTRLDPSTSIPVKKEIGALCLPCASHDVADHPVTPTYLGWMQNNDPRWWSAWTCNCEGCAH